LPASVTRTSWPGLGRVADPDPARARFHRLHRRVGGRTNNTAGTKAAFAVAHTLIKVIWSVLTSGQPYNDLGHDFHTTRRVNPERHTRRLIAQLGAISGKKIILADHDDEPPSPDTSDGTPDGETAAGTGLSPHPHIGGGKNADKAVSGRRSDHKGRQRGRSPHRQPSLPHPTQQRQALHHARQQRVRLRRDAAAHVVKIRGSSQAPGVAALK
jgi:hypothetical protein